MSYLYSRFVKSMLTLSYRITNDLNDAEDIVQEAFIHSFKNIHQLKDAQKYNSWLKRIVVNNSIRFIQVKSKHNLININDEIIDESDTQTNWQASISAERLNENIQSLPDGCRTILTLYALEGYSHKEVAESCQISISTSKSQYLYALKLLRKKLSKYL